MFSLSETVRKNLTGFLPFKGQIKICIIKSISDLKMLLFQYCNHSLLPLLDNSHTEIKKYIYVYEDRKRENVL